MNSAIRTVLTTIAICSLLPAWTINAQTDQTDQPLRWKLKQGEKLSVLLEQNTGVKTMLGNREQETGNEMLMTLQWNVTSAANNEFVIEQTIERIQLTINAPSENGIQTTKLDTSEEEGTGKLAEHLLQQIRPLIGTVHSITMNDRGEISDVSIPKDSKEAIRQAPSSMQIRQIVSEDGIKEMIGQGAIVFPSESISSGDDWSEQKTVQNGLGEITTTTKFTYNGPQEIDGGKVEQFSASILMTSDAKKLKEGVKISGFDGKGKIMFAAEAKNVLATEFSNQLTTKRNYRETIIESTVTTETKTKVTRDDG